MKAPEPARTRRAVQPKRPRGWTPAVWDLRCALLAASRSLNRTTGLQSFLEGAERWVKKTGRYQTGPGATRKDHAEWWATAMAVVDVVGRIGDEGTLAMLWPWLVHDGLRQAEARAAAGGFTPFGVD